jgi:type IV pilus assembly protein PilA
MKSLSNYRQTIWSDAHGFTLIELMVVVGMIGILVSIASTKYERYQRKARQTEAKIGLSSIYAFEKSFYAEYNAYHYAFDAIGYLPELNKRFYFQALTNDCAAGGAVAGFTGGGSIRCYNAYLTPFSQTAVLTGTCTNLSGAGYAADSQTFVSYFQGNLGAAADDVWTINQNKVLVNCSNGT